MIKSRCARLFKTLARGRGHSSRRVSVQFSWVRFNSVLFGSVRAGPACRRPDALERSEVVAQAKSDRQIGNDLDAAACTTRCEIYHHIYLRVCLCA
jgi:hypothetical protein